MSYATVDELRARMESDGVTTMPAVDILQMLLDTAGAAIDAYCRRDFILHSDDQAYIAGNGNQSLILANYPLLSVSAITEDGEALSASELSELTYWEHGEITGRTWASGSTYQITHTWGYATPPALVKEAALRLASRAHRLRSVKERAAVGLRSETIEGYTIQLEPLEIDRDVALLLQRYRRRRAAH